MRKAHQNIDNRFDRLLNVDEAIKINVDYGSGGSFSSEDRAKIVKCIIDFFYHGIDGGIYDTPEKKISYVCVAIKYPFPVWVRLFMKLKVGLGFDSMGRYLAHERAMRLRGYIYLYKYYKLLNSKEATGRRTMLDDRTRALGYRAADLVFSKLEDRDDWPFAYNWSPRFKILYSKLKGQAKRESGSRSYYEKKAGKVLFEKIEELLDSAFYEGLDLVSDSEGDCECKYCSDYSTDELANELKLHGGLSNYNVNTIKYAIPYFVKTTRKTKIKSQSF